MCGHKVLAWVVVLSILSIIAPPGDKCWAKGAVRHEVSVNGLIVGGTGDAAVAGALQAGLERGIGLWLVQFNGPIKEREREAVERLGVRLHDYLPEFAFLAGMDGGMRPRVLALPFIEGVSRFHPGYKMNGKLRKMALEPVSGEAVTLQLKLADPASLAQVLGALRQLGAQPLTVGRDLVRVRVETGALAGIAALEEVTWIGEYVEMELFNDTTSWVIQSNTPGNTGIWDKGLHGEGEIVGVGDTGLDHDIPWIRDPAGTAIGASHRKLLGYDTTYGDDYDSDYPGHGTHVCGTLAGDRTPVDGLTTANGMAPKARLFLQDLAAGATNGVYPPDDMGLLFGRAYEAGARLHSNSWGSSDRSYSAFTQSVDRFLWEHPDFLALYANGNTGPASSTVGSPANAKNVVSVGASYNGSEAQNLASFSSNGPTADGRIKPTLVAPGVGIVSADSDGIKNSFNSGTTTMSGTSMATPAVAGAAALVRQYFAQGYYPLRTATPVNAFLPPGALVKAVLINSARDMTGTGTDGPIPATGQGWGRVQLDRGLPFADAAGTLAVVNQTAGLGTEGAWNGQFRVPGGEPFKVTLVWADYPGAVGAAKALVNDLDLSVTAPDGSLFLGNVFAAGASVTGGVPDRLNVEEQVLIKAPASGLYTVSVSGYNVPMGPQPFALAVTGASGASQRGTIILDRGHYTSSGTLQIQVTDTGLDRNHEAAEQVSVRVVSSAEPAGEEALLRETALASGVFSGTLRLAAAPVLPADGVLQVSGTDTIVASYFDADDGTGRGTTVTATAVVDNVAPVCSGLAVSPPSDTAATVLWSTDEPAAALLRYGSTPELGGEVADLRLLTRHEILLSALRENSSYYLSAVSTDEAGNAATCSTSFVTASLPPVLLVTSSTGSTTYRGSTIISGTGTDASGVASVTVNGTAVGFRPTDGYFEIELPLTMGDNLFSVLASDTLGNTSRRDVTVTRLPVGDLLVQSVSGPASALQGGNITVADIVCNNGSGEAPPSAVGFYLSADVGYSADDLFIGSRSITAQLAAGSCANGASTLAIPLSAPGGTWYLVACADYRNAVQESDESNNCRAGTRLTLPLLPVASPGAMSVPLSNSTDRFPVSWGSCGLSGAVYVLEYSREGAEWTQVYSGTATYSYVMVTQNGSYSFRVKAVKSGYLDSAYRVSDNSCFVTLACGAPASITVPSSDSTGRFLISWGTSNVSGVNYLMEYSYNGGAWTQVFSGAGNYAYFSASASGSYAFRVKAVKTGYADSSYTTGATPCVVALACGAPASITFPSSNNTGTVLVSWGSSNVTGVSYVAEYSRNGGTWSLIYSGSGNYVYFSTSVNGSYTFRVKAVKTGYADSSYTTGATPCVVALACGAPASITVPSSSSTGTVLVSWGSSNVTGVSYVAEYSLNGGTWSLIYSGSGNYVYFSTSVNGSYTFRVKAVKTGYADSSYTTGATPCVVALACGAPASITFPSSNSTGTVLVSWGSSNVTGVSYVAEYSRNGGTWSLIYSGTASYVYFSAAASGSYVFRVKAVKTGYTDSPYRLSSACRVDLVCGAPASISVPATNNTGKFPVSWGSSNVSGVTYVLEYSRDGSAWAPIYTGTATYAYFSTSTSGSYSFRVKAVRTGYGDSGYTAAPAPCIVTLN
ncbi:S8 family serine peptidase [Geomonas oryzae]|uniref:S8 family serine peptidase n=1 Tax=Geomonas oryzae TaxID=2364273 RepID=UPI00100A47B6|nr:S8 family serine peptidase [Geomonas oryzae]